MNARRIRLIIGLMTAALLGIIGLQIYWIDWNIRLNEEQFDKNVFSALNKVAGKLQYLETVSVLEAMNQSRGETGNVQRTAQLLQNGYAAQALGNADTLPNPVGEGGTFEDNVTMWEYMKVTQLLDSKPLAERVPLDVLAQSIQDEIGSRGIQAEYQYGVYSKARNSYVIVNDHFVVEDSGPQITHGGAPTLYNSPYKVALFTQDMESPGYLSLYFPNRTRLVLASVLPTLVLSVVFTGIILFCFWYTIQVIFRQKKLSEMKNDFINNMTHEFKTPIATISLAADSIGSPMIMSHPDKIKRFVDIIRQENRRMNSQVERVLQMAMIDKKDFQLSLDELNLHEVIQQAVDNFSLQVEKRDGTLRTDLQAKRPVIEGDATHIASIIHNLLDNANKYSPEQPDITIGTRDVPMGVEISVTDKGIGISKDARKHIFDKFYRVHTGNIHDVKGFGLGLSYVKAIMTAHKGLVDVKSEPGKGSTFILTFPKTVTPQTERDVAERTQNRATVEG
ncbi:MAG: sensor histidine kinase [Haliscomenobacteraceae bacterium CHB4]|nr:Adaptive-response sensory-kinase SasA [Saprospiraceae bacterium]MCE7924158.1 sensor histidine kinase [Haliscomenobacteraceae bacterium CHB4]